MEKMVSKELKDNAVNQVFKVSKVTLDQLVFLVLESLEIKVRLVNKGMLVRLVIKENVVTKVLLAKLESLDALSLVFSVPWAFQV